LTPHPDGHISLVKVSPETFIWQVVAQTRETYFFSLLGPGGVLSAASSRGGGGSEGQPGTKGGEGDFQIAAGLVVRVERSERSERRQSIRNAKQRYVCHRSI